MPNNALLPQSNHRRDSVAHARLARDRDSAYHQSVAQSVNLRTHDDRAKDIAGSFQSQSGP
jgi:hypothetical protein